MNNTLKYRQLKWAQVANLRQTGLSIFNFRILIIVVSIFMFISCGITTYRTFELPETDNYGRILLFSDSLIDLKIGAHANDFSRDMSLRITGSLKEKSEFIIDSISVNKFFLQDSLINYKLTTIDVYNFRDKSVYFKKFKDIPDEIKLLNKANESITYSLQYWDFTREPASDIPKTVKNITLEIFVQYDLNNVTYEKIFTVHLQSKTHRYLWILRDD